MIILALCWEALSKPGYMKGKPKYSVAEVHDRGSFI